MTAPTTASTPPAPRRSGAGGALADYFPALAPLPRAGLLGALPTPVEPSVLAPGLWVKRDDLTALPIGGNNVRALALLLGGLGERAEVLTAGAVGSTHSLTTVVHAKRLRAPAAGIRWPPEMKDVARAAEIGRASCRGRE